MKNMFQIVLIVVLFFLIGSSVLNIIEFLQRLPLFIRHLSPPDAVIYSLFRSSFLMELLRGLAIYGVFMLIAFIIIIVAPMIVIYFLISSFKGPETAQKLCLRWTHFVGAVFIILWVILAMTTSTTEEQFSLVHTFIEFVVMFTILFRKPGDYRKQ